MSYLPFRSLCPALALGFLLGSCISVATLKGYPGPAQDEAQLGRLTRDIFKDSHTTALVYITHVDPTEGQDPALLHSKGFPRAMMLPGERTIRGYLHLDWVVDLGPFGLGRIGQASVDIGVKEITFTAEAGHQYMLKAALHPVFLEHWESRAKAANLNMEKTFDFRVDAEVLTMPSGEEGVIATILPNYYSFWIEDEESGAVVAGSPPPEGTE